MFDVPPDNVEATVDRWISAAVDDPTSSYTAPDFAEHLRTGFSTFAWLLEPMLHQAGFDIIDREVRNSVYAAYTC